jgi:hypothetical protein
MQATCLFHPRSSAFIIAYLLPYPLNPLFPAENNEKAEPWTVTS